MEEPDRDTAKCGIQPTTRRIIWTVAEGGEDAFLPSDKWEVEQDTLHSTVEEAACRGLLSNQLVIAPAALQPMNQWGPKKCPTSSAQRRSGCLLCIQSVVSPEGHPSSRAKGRSGRLLRIESLMGLKRHPPSRARGKQGSFSHTQWARGPKRCPTVSRHECRWCPLKKTVSKWKMSLTTYNQTKRPLQGWGRAQFTSERVKEVTVKRMWWEVSVRTLSVLPLMVKYPNLEWWDPS